MNYLYSMKIVQIKLMTFLQKKKIQNHSCALEKEEIMKLLKSRNIL